MEATPPLFFKKQTLASASALGVEHSSRDNPELPHRFSTWPETQLGSWAVNHKKPKKKSNRSPGRRRGFYFIINTGGGIADNALLDLTC
jgi:hypothetical protein